MDKAQNYDSSINTQSSQPIDLTFVACACPIPEIVNRISHEFDISVYIRSILDNLTHIFSEVVRSLQTLA
jgi:hypothetical protein